jgi:hypothetical protein
MWRSVARCATQAAAAGSAPVAASSSFAVGNGSLVGRGVAATAQRASIRTQIPPRPAVTVITYLDRYGNPIKTKQETDLSLIRTRDNKFFLQRVMVDESIIRFAAPGLGMIKNAANFEYFSIQEIDVYGGVVVPNDLMPVPAHERPYFHDAVHVMMQVKPVKKFTRKDRRIHHRKLFTHWEANPEKYRFAFMFNAVFTLTICSWVLINVVSLERPDDPLEPNNAGPQRHENSIFTYADNWMKRHPEHNTIFSSTIDFTPGQLEYVQRRSESMDSDTDVTTGIEWIWKLRHARTYGHWPKGIRE